MQYNSIMINRIKIIGLKAFFEELKVIGWHLIAPDNFNSKEDASNF